MDPSLPSAPQLTPEVVCLLLQMQSARNVEPQNNGKANRGPWSRAEDNLLRNAIRTFGSKQWTQIAKCLPNRNGRQCRERWYNQLKPGTRHEPFAPWEDQLIIAKQKELGNRWVAISQQLNGRSANAVKNRWYAGLRQSHEQSQETGKRFEEELDQEIMLGVDFAQNESSDL